MNEWNRGASIGGVVLALSLIGVMFYELVLYPGAGFPTNDYAVIVAGANTLRIGHILKFGYAIGLVLLFVGMASRVQSSPTLAHLANITAIGAATLFVASGMLGLRILQVAQDTFTTNPPEAVTTILLRSVTIALFEAGIFVSGAFALVLSLALLRGRIVSPILAYAGILVGVLFLFDRLLVLPFNYIAPLIAIPWALGLAFSQRRQNEQKVSSAWSGSE